jgi:hypothetical protein
MTGALTKSQPTSCVLTGLSGLAYRPRKRARREAVDKWTVRAGARSGPLAVHNALRYPPRGPLPTCPKPSTTTFKEPSSENSLFFFWKIQGHCARAIRPSSEKQSAPSSHPSAPPARSSTAKSHRVHRRRTPVQLDKVRGPSKGLASLRPNLRQLLKFDVEALICLALSIHVD